MSAKKKSTPGNTRENFLNMISQVNLVMQEVYYPRVETALKEQNKKAFKDVALVAGVNPAAVDELYKILLSAYMESTKETAVPWMI